MALQHKPSSDGLTQDYTQESTKPYNDALIQALEQRSSQPKSRSGTPSQSKLLNKPLAELNATYASGSTKRLLTGLLALEAYEGRKCFDDSTHTLTTSTQSPKIQAPTSATFRPDLPKLKTNYTLSSQDLDSSRLISQSPSLNTPHSSKSHVAPSDRPKVPSSLKNSIDPEPTSALQSPQMNTAPRNSKPTNDSLSHDRQRPSSAHGLVTHSNMNDNAQTPETHAIVSVISQTSMASSCDSLFVPATKHRHAEEFAKPHGLGLTNTTIEQVGATTNDAQSSAMHVDTIMSNSEQQGTVLGRTIVDASRDPRQRRI